MRRYLKIVFSLVGGLLVAALFLQAGYNAVQASRLESLADSPRLTGAEKTQLTETRRLQRELGARIWPGFEQADLPLILFTDRYEFLLGPPAPPSPWEPVEGDTVDGQPYYRRPAADPQAFAVPVGETWAGSMGTQQRLNRDVNRGMREELPGWLAWIFPYQLIYQGPEQITASLLHETFHAFQAVQNPARFQAVQNLSPKEKGYPFETALEGWNEEGQALKAALEAADDSQAREHAKRFLTLRRQRRAGLSGEQTAMEQEFEWLEGLALHIQLRFYEQAALEPADKRVLPFKPGARAVTGELDWLQRGLGSLDGDHRFYISGMAQARLLDRFAPGWQTRALGDGVWLEDLLEGAL